MTFDTTTTTAIKALFDEYGVKGQVSVLTPVTADEAVFVVSTSGAATMNERPLTESLAKLLGRKVWVSTELGCSIGSFPCKAVWDVVVELRG